MNKLLKKFFKNYFIANKRFIFQVVPFLLLTLQLSTFAKISGPEPIKLRYSERFIYKVFGASAPGSGLLILLPDGNVALITAEHVISGMGNNEEIEVQITAKKSLFVQRNNAIVMPGYDLAFVLLNRKELEVDMDNTYYLTEIEGDKSLVGQKVSVAGFPLSDNSIVENVRVSPGIIQTIGDSTSKDGYSLGYSSKTYVGMSGGGVFSANGKLIGIHGRGEAIQSNDRNKTGTNYAVLARDAIKFYRSTIKNEIGKDKLTEASRSVLDGNFKNALELWKKIAIRYPDSMIVKYNVECLNSITKNKKFPKSNYPKIFEPDFRVSMVQGSRQENKTGFLYEYKNDPLVKKLTNTSEIKSLDPLSSLPFGMKNIPGMSSMPSMTEMIYPQKISSMLSIMQRDSAPYYERANIKGKKNRCLLFTTHRSSQAMEPPLLIETMVTPQMRP